MPKIPPLIAPLVDLATGRVLSGPWPVFFQPESRAVWDAGISGTAKTVTWGQGSVQSLTLSGDVTITFAEDAMPTERKATVAAGPYMLLMLTGSGGHTVTWPTTVRWAGGTPPTATAAANRLDMARLLYLPSAGLWFGEMVQDFPAV